jgi:hypothetical protein
MRATSLPAPCKAAGARAGFEHTPQSAEYQAAHANALAQWRYRKNGACGRISRRIIQVFDKMTAMLAIGVH